MSTHFEPLSVEVEAHDDGCVVSAKGAICDDGTLEMRRRLLGAHSSGSSRVLVDLSGVNYISSSGIGMLVSILKRCHKDEISFALCGLNKDILELFQLTRLDQVFAILPDRSAWDQGKSSS